MKKGVLAALLVIILLSAAAACQNAGSGTETEDLEIMPFSERRFLCTNGLDYEEKQFSGLEGSTRLYRSDLVLSGFKNKEVQDRVNKDIADSVVQEMGSLEAAVISENGGKATGIRSKETGAHIAYSCNNVIFIEYYAILEFAVNPEETESRQKLAATGYDLNTGSKLQLKDLFKKGSGYEKLINDFISLYIIGNNFDDPDSGYMSKPFQGIREGQSFSFGIGGLKIIMDEKNDEFQDPGYPIAITIPLSMIGEELAVFDRYYDGKTNIFEEKGIKKLLPNRSEFKTSSLLQESRETYSIYVEEGEFTGVEDNKVKAMLDNLAAFSLDVDAFRKKAEAQAALNPGKYFGSIGHTVSTAMNAGGYTSVTIRDSYYENGKGQETTKYINYDFNSNKVMKLADIFSAGYGYRTAIAEILNDPDNGYLSNYSEQAKIKVDSISGDNFSFDENGVLICLNLQKDDGTYDSYWVSYEKIGWDNLAMYGECPVPATRAENKDNH